MPKPVEVRALANYRIWLRYDDGMQGEVDLGDLAGRGVFNPHDRTADLPRMPSESLEGLSPEENTRIWAEEAHRRLVALDRGELKQPAGR